MIAWKSAGLFARRSKTSQCLGIVIPGHAATSSVRHMLKSSRAMSSEITPRSMISLSEDPGKFIGAPVITGSTGGGLLIGAVSFDVAVILLRRSCVGFQKATHLLDLLFQLCNSHICSLSLPSLSWRRKHTCSIRLRASLALRRACIRIHKTSDLGYATCFAGAV